MLWVLDVSAMACAEKPRSGLADVLKKACVLFELNVLFESDVVFKSDVVWETDVLSELVVLFELDGLFESNVLSELDVLFDLDILFELDVGHGYADDWQSSEILWFSHLASKITEMTLLKQQY